MGNSETSTYADGRPLYDAVDAWPRAVREHLAAFTRSSGPSPLVALNAVVAADVVTVLRDSGARKHLERAARRWDLDEADAALLWPAKASRDPAQAMHARAEFVARTERRLATEIARAFGPRRVPAATHLALRARLLAAAASMPPERLPKPRGLGRWLRGPNGRRLVASIVGAHG